MSVENLIIPKEYSSELNIIDTERAIKFAKDMFERELAKALELTRVSAPLFVRHGSGLNDNLNGVERAVSFEIKELGFDAEIVHSLAKWKRMALLKYKFPKDTGLYTDMNAIRRDEDMDNLHSIYVDQWDWEKIITRDERNRDLLKETVRKIVGVVKQTELEMAKAFPQLKPFLPDDVYFITTQELLDEYPDLSPKEREDAICKKHGIVFIMQIGGRLSNGTKHDGRAPDYDDWELNGDILVWYPLLDRAVEISSMGIRVDDESLRKQLKEANCEERSNLPFHKMLLNGELPLTMGGGIGQSRLCMLLLQKAHVGEVQASIWSDEMIDVCDKNNIHLL